jgi:hypothetical protein
MRTSIQPSHLVTVSPTPLPQHSLPSFMLNLEMLYDKRVNCYQSCSISTKIQDRLICEMLTTIMSLWSVLLAVYIIYLGHAIAEVVSRCLPTTVARVRAEVWQVGFVVDKVASGQVFSKYFGFPCQNHSFHQLIRHHNHPGQLAESL